MPPGTARDASADNAPPPCTLCGSEDTRLRFQKEGYRHYHCRACKGLFLFPIPSREELEAFYRKTDGEQQSSLCWTSSRRHVWSTWQWALNRIEHLCGRGPVLDVGCGAGQFLHFAGKKGWEERTGVELGPEAAEHARKNSGATIHTVDLLEARLPSASFCGVTMWDVIEHLADPHAILREVRRLLRPGGVLVVTAPHRYGVAIRFLKQRALIVMPPEHLTYYSRRSMRRLLESEQFSVKKIRCVDIYIREWTRILFRSRSETDEPKDDKNYQAVYDRLVQSSVFLFAMRAANVFLDPLNLGDQMIAVSQKTLSE